MKQFHAIFVLITLVLCAMFGVNLAQTKSDPLDPTSPANFLGLNLYLYNSATDSIVSLAGNGGLTMVPWQYYDNTTMLWTITSYGGTTPSYYISAASPQAAGCTDGSAANWNALKKSAVNILCSSSTSVYTNFALVSTAIENSFNIVPKSNAAACVTVVNGGPTSPSTTCNPLGQFTQWQLVNIYP